MSGSETTQIRSERRDAAENRQRILNAAIKLFEQNGVEQVSMNQIASEAQVGSGTLYRRYRNKGELCLDLLKDTLINYLMILKPTWSKTILLLQADD